MEGIQRLGCVGTYIYHVFCFFFAPASLVCVHLLDALLVNEQALRMADQTALKLDEYRGANHWKGLIPKAAEPRVWDEGFRSFLIK